MQWLLLALIPILFAVSWLYTVSVAKTRFPRLRNQRICLLIAHPDDEAMFFAPTLLALTEPELGNHVKILCLSSGDADGLGETRKKELKKSATMLGLRTEDDVFIVERPDFVDGMHTNWSKDSISNLLSSAFTPEISKPLKSKSVDAPKATIDVLVTFDDSGISSHPNHISLYHGSRQYISSLIHNRPGWKSPVNLYTLTSIGLVRKYSSFFDAIISLGLISLGKKNLGTHPSPLLFMNSPGEVRQAQNAMTKAHVSQMKWFRWGWIGLSRYMVINDLKLEHVS